MSPEEVEPIGDELTVAEFSWYPAHIAKAERELQQKWLPLLDVLLELVDARLPHSSRYPNRDIFGRKPIVTIYTKRDLSSLSVKASSNALLVDGRSPHRWQAKLATLVHEASSEIREKLQKQGRRRKLRLGVCGMPNVGKSTFLNGLLAGKKKAKTGNQPGVTRQMQFVSGKDFDLLDTPGLCPIKVSPEAAQKLAICQLLPTKLFDEEVLAQKLVMLLNNQNCTADLQSIGPKALLQRFREGKYGPVNLDLDLAGNPTDCR